MLSCLARACCRNILKIREYTNNFVCKDCTNNKLTNFTEKINLMNILDYKSDDVSLRSLTVGFDPMTVCNSCNLQVIFHENINIFLTNKIQFSWMNCWTGWNKIEKNIDKRNSNRKPTEKWTVSGSVFNSVFCLQRQRRIDIHTYNCLFLTLLIVKPAHTINIHVTRHHCLTHLS